MKTITQWSIVILALTLGYGFMFVMFPIDLADGVEIISVGIMGFVSSLGALFVLYLLTSWLEKKKITLFAGTIIDKIIGDYCERGVSSKIKVRRETTDEIVTILVSDELFYGDTLKVGKLIQCQETEGLITGNIDYSLEPES